MKIDDKIDAVYIPDSPSRIKADDYNQIKNEIQECISEAGLTPTKDVIQLPKALRTIAEASSTEAAKYAEEALASKEAAETAQNNSAQNASLAEIAKEEAQQSAQNAASAAATAVSSHNTDSNAHADIRNALAEKATSADVDEEISEINSTLARKQDDGEFHPEDYGWPDIRPAARPNAIAIMAGVKADYSAYDNLGFTATCEGGYNVYIDGVQYGSTFSSGAQCSITWSQYSATTGFSVSYPEELTAHIVQIAPAVSGNNITAFACARVASSGEEQMGCLWAHFNLANTINLQDCFRSDAWQIGGKYLNLKLTAVTAKNNELKVNNIRSFVSSTAVSYIPTLVLDGSVQLFNTFFDALNPIAGNALKKISIKGGTIASLFRTFNGDKRLEEIVFSGCECNLGSDLRQLFGLCYALRKLPNIDYSNVTTMSDFLRENYNLKDTFLDLSYADKVTTLGAYGTSVRPITGLKGLLVSQNAPFTGSSPQINVSYTGLDHNALVALFNSLPTVTAGQIINITGATGASALTAQQLAIATNKGWTVTR